MTCSKLCLYHCVIATEPAVATLRWQFLTLLARVYIFLVLVSVVDHEFSAIKVLTFLTLCVRVVHIERLLSSLISRIGSFGCPLRCLLRSIFHQLSILDLRWELTHASAPIHTHLATLRVGVCCHWIKCLRGTLLAVSLVQVRLNLRPLCLHNHVRMNFGAQLTGRLELNAPFAIST